MEPTISTGDIGELTAAAYHLGVAHPPGYPISSVWAHLFQLVPIGNIAFRSNLASVWSTAIAAVLLAAAAWRVTSGQPYAKWMVGGLVIAWGLSERVWGQAVEVEVYALQTCLAATVFWGIIRADRIPSAWHGVGVLLGCAMIHHPLSWFWTPVVVYLWWKSKHRLGEGWKWWPASVALGWMWCIFLPLRALSYPEMDWAHPTGLGEVLSHVFRSQYGQIQGPVRGAASFAKQIGWYVEWLNAQWPWWSWAIAAWGWWRLKQIAPRPAWVSLWLFGMTSVGLIIALNPAGGPTANYLNREFFVVTSIVVGAWILSALMEWKVMGVAVALVLCLVQCWPPIEAQGAVAYWYARNILGLVESHAVLFAAGDKGVIPLAYLAKVEGWRPDITMIDDIGCVFGNIYGEDFLALSAETQEARRTAAQQRVLADSSDRPVFTMEGSHLYRSATRFTSYGFVQRLDRSERVAPGYEMALRRCWMDPAWESAGDYIARDMVAEYHYLKAEDAEKKGLRDAAKREYRIAERVAEDVPWVKTKIARKFSEQADNTEEGVRLAEEAVRLDPSTPQGHNSLGLAYMDAKRIDDAMVSFRKALDLQPHFTEGHNNLGNAYLAKGMNKEARAAYERTLQLDPGHIRAHNNLGILLFREGKFIEAIREFEQAVKLDPAYVNAHSNLGSAYYKVGKIPEAVREWEFVLKLDPRHAEARQNLEVVRQK